MHARETDQTLNGDGFGLGWYEHSIDNSPGLFRSTQPAWNNLNLVSLTGKIKSTSFFAHVRAASQGGVANDNCHPFMFKNILFMHNGTIYGFQKIKRQIRRILDDDIYDWVKGQTDSEHFFALFIQTLRENNLTTENMDSFYNNLVLTINRLRALLKEHNAEALAYLNIAITDGERTLVCRYVTDPKAEASTLHYAVGDKFVYEHAAGHMYPVKDKPGAVLVSSEKLTDYNFEWHMVTQNYCILIEEDLTTTLKEMDNCIN
jgi:predicted glutamine amidotransferase